MRRTRAAIALALSCTLHGAVQAQAAALPLAHPLTTAFIDAQLRETYAPAAKTWQADAERATAALDAYCSGDAQGADARRTAARDAWTQSMLSWTRLSAISIGPLIARRSEARVDFFPLRVPALEKQLAGAKASTQWDIDKIGAQARGFSALEWLLWTKPAAPRSPACRYALLLSQDVQTEAAGLATDFAALAAATRDDAAAAALFNETINQWLAGLSRLRWRELEMPARSWGMSQAPRAASGNTAAAWAQRWAALRTGAEPLLEYLRARGAVEPAEVLARELRATDAQLAGITPATPPQQLMAASKAADAAGHAMSDRVALALQVTLEFSSDDGD